MERREAQRLTSLAARIPKAAPPATGSSLWMRLVDRKVRPAGLVSLLPEGPRKPLAPPGAPSLIEETEKGTDGRRTSLNNWRAERWLDVSHWAKQETNECGGTRGWQDDEGAGVEEARRAG